MTVKKNRLQKIEGAGAVVFKVSIKPDLCFWRKHDGLPTGKKKSQSRREPSKKKWLTE